MLLLQQLTTHSTGTYPLFTDLNLNFLIRLGIDLAAVLILVRGIYYRTYRRADLFLTFFSFNFIIFLISFLLNKVEMSMGAAFGLFAVFSMLRYRTESISLKDMTYLFLVIALGLISAISKGGGVEQLLFNGVILTVTFLLESPMLMKKESAQLVYYERIELIPPQQRDELLSDLRIRTGLNVHRVEVNEIDLLKDAARLTVYYYQ
ncbi:DUF4956 domain-containing protein [Arsenicibacter rosenii]|uniref:DUF4956 domain-containing protein n=1 Tax=Arsenicibacter rosenii TaxID=1750698 RepID=A0A1S2VL31_9BACT|nr:DUF4956 domain-containing protein [Arsenicibacter rosenii]OIN59477.1 DUF4956 domain-containing protein [Arsenicibacter rosenii]